jgi:hypothetical protein
MSVFDHWNPGFDYVPGLEDGPETPEQGYREAEARELLKDSEDQNA